jgi:hypothetical protein
VDLKNIASRVASINVEAARRKTKKVSAPKKKKPTRNPEELLDIEDDILKSEPECACHIELDITANFEGQVDKKILIKKIKAELLSAVQSSMTVVSKELNLSSKGVKVRPLRLEVDFLDM